MTEENKGTQNPPPKEGTPAGEQTPEKAPVDTEKEQLKADLAEANKKATEHEAQKEHWRGKYERDITNVPNPEPAPPSEEGAFSDEGKHLEKEIGNVKSDVADVKHELAKKDLQTANPVLKEKWADFEEFRKLPENKGMNMRTAAKSYLVENDLVEKPAAGLEKPTGGDRTPTSSEMTTEDIKHLRETDYDKYRQLVIDDKIKV